MALGELIYQLLRIHELLHQCQYHQHPWLKQDDYACCDGDACVEQELSCLAITMMGS